jgi:hypothetical protein
MAARLCRSLCGLWLLTAATPAGWADPKPSDPKPNPSKSLNLLLTDPRLAPHDTLMSKADWSAIRRAATTRFHPTRDQITDESKPKALLRQLARPATPTTDSPGRALSTDEHIELQESVDATQRAYERPASSRTVEITVKTSETGQVLGMAVSLPSGSPRFDEEAMLCLRDAFASYPPTEERRPMMSRWRVRAGYAVTLPKAMAPMVARTPSGRMPSRGIPLLAPIWGTFDETRGTAQTHHAFADKIDTQIELLSRPPD